LNCRAPRDGNGGIGTAFKRILKVFGTIDHDPSGSEEYRAKFNDNPLPIRSEKLGTLLVNSCEKRKFEGKRTRCSDRERLITVYDAAFQIRFPIK
jgi:hypothetical protein